MKQALEGVARHFFREELFGKLLRERAAATGAFLQQDAAFHQRAEKRFGIDARMLGEAHVFGSDQRMDDGR